MGRPPCCDKSNVKRGLWTAEEDAKILAYVANHGVGNWTLVPHKAGLNRCGKSCRLRWTNYLRADLKHDNFTPDEEQLILDYHQAIGSRWSLIAKQLPGRTDNDVKNYWNTKLKKKLSKMGIDPVTHKPFSQILSDYGKITGLPNTTGKPIGLVAALDISTNNMPRSAVLKPPQPSLVPMELSNNTMINNIYKPLPLPEQFFQDKSFTEVSSLISSSSSSCSVTRLSSPQSFSCLPSLVSVTPSSPSSWCAEFLLGDDDHILSAADAEQKQAQNLQMLASVCPPMIALKNKRPYCEFNEVTQEKGCEAMYIEGQTKHCSEAASSSSANSFVEAILDRDSELQLQFPEFFNEYFNY